MDFIERLLHISPDGGNGSSEFLIIGTIIFAVIITAMTVRRHDLLRTLMRYLEQLGNRESGDRFDN
jgi:hypothetical protein